MSESPESLAAYAPSSSPATSPFSRDATASTSASDSPPDSTLHTNHDDDHHNHNNHLSSRPDPAPAPTASEKTFHSKRPHKKSRAGCKNCKARKVKCDEVRPTCRSCRLRKADCVYPDLPPPTTKLTASSSSSSSVRASHKADVRHASADLRAIPVSSADTPTPSSTTELPFHPPPRQPALSSNVFTDPVFTSFDPDDDLNLFLPDDPSAGQDLGDPAYDATTPLIVVAEPLFRPLPYVDDIELKLMWWYTSQTSASFSLSLDTSVVTPSVEIMRNQLVQNAFRVPFLMDSIYALTALHLSQIDPTGATIDPRRAIHYRQRSYLGYRKAIEAAEPATFPALLCNSLLLCALSSQTFRDPDASDLYIIDWMVVWKGIGLIIDLISVSGLFDSGLQALFFRPQVNLADAATSAPNHLLFMVSSIPSHDLDYPDRETYYATLKHLGSLFANLRSGGVNQIMALRIVTAFTFVPPRFVELARMRRPRTLVILAYYAMFFKLIPVAWWTVGIGQRTLRDVCKHLGPEWHHLLRAPMMATHVDDPVAIARLILEDPTWEAPGKEALRSEVEQQIKELSWVDNAGRRMIIQPSLNRMVARESPDGPDLVPYFDRNKSKDDLEGRYCMDYGISTAEYNSAATGFGSDKLADSHKGGVGETVGQLGTEDFDMGYAPR